MTTSISFFGDHQYFFLDAMGDICFYPMVAILVKKNANLYSFCSLRSILGHSLNRRTMHVELTEKLYEQVYHNIGMWITYRIWNVPSQIFK
uniref:Uncharacterized protein n=1 Tax=Aegilops tauschii subsp. strangulata TaxID=200361 RepID=A0A452ZEC4_AEGTS